MDINSAITTTLNEPIAFYSNPTPSDTLTIGQSPGPSLCQEAKIEFTDPRAPPAKRSDANASPGPLWSGGGRMCLMAFGLWVSEFGGSGFGKSLEHGNT